jgi:hypothetical protein
MHARAIPMTETSTSASAGSTIDWSEGERLYRAGQLSNHAIARAIGCSETMVRKKAARMGWKRDLAAAVKSRVKEKLVREAVREPRRKKVTVRETKTRAQDSEPKREPERPPAAPRDELTASVTRTLEVFADDETAIERAAESAVAVVREHRASLRSGQDLCAKLFAELIQSTELRAEIAAEIEKNPDLAKQHRMLQAVSLPQRAQTLRDLSLAMQRFQLLERRAWGLDDQTEPPPTPLDELPESALIQRITVLVGQVNLPSDVLPSALRPAIDAKAH